MTEATALANPGNGPDNGLASRILVVRGVRVLLDSDLAVLYGVTTKRLNEQVRRNSSRFPSDFMFRLTEDEALALRSQSATSKSGRGGRRYLPSAFTEHGAVMLASVLNSAVAVNASILVVRAFIRLRGLAAAHADLARRLDDLERRCDAKFAAVFAAIRKLMEPSLPGPPRRRIGFRGNPDDHSARPARGRR